MIIGKCLICNGNLKNNTDSVIMKCYKCGKREKGHIVCENDHYLCDTCASDSIISNLFFLLPEIEDKNPVDIGEKLMAKCGISGNSPHVITAAAFLLAIKNTSGIITNADVFEGVTRATQIPGGWCGFYGTCGAAVGLGTAYSVITKATPLSDKERSQANEITAKGLTAVAELGGPRCCAAAVRAILEVGVEIAKEYLNITFPERVTDSEPCWVSKYQPDCKHKRCKYFFAQDFNVLQKQG